MAAYEFCQLCDAFVRRAADRAGIRFAEVATASEASARALQSALAAGAKETDFFPRVGDLPEGLSDAEFKANFGDVDSPAYGAMVKQIDSRIAKIALYN